MTARIGRSVAEIASWRGPVTAATPSSRTTLADRISAYRPLAFAPPYGSYGQGTEGTNDSRIPPDLLGWLTNRYRAVFTQDQNARAKPGSKQPLGRIQVDRSMSGGEVYYSLLSGKSP